MSPKVDEVDYNLLSNIYEHVKNNSKMLSAILSKLNELPDGKDAETKEEEKKKMEEIFEKRGVGKPRGTFEEKQKQYFEMVKAGKIKNRVAKTLDYYHIMKDERGEYIINLLPK
jgi:spore coat polysaccharide biosynthesis protein SpsF (cytidylyltransferase family)